MGIRLQVNRLLRGGKYSLKKINELTCLADSFGSDKGTLLSAHLYTRIYDKIFSAIRNERLIIVEIGLLRTDIDKRRATNAAEGEVSVAAARAPSLEMWRAYFPHAQIFGFDIDDFSKVKIDGCTILQGDMSSQRDLSRLVHTIGRSIDVVIEDGSHASHHQQIALGALFPNLCPGGLYVVEDLHWQDPSVEKTDAPKTRDLLRRLQIDGIFRSPYLSDAEQRYIGENTDKISLFDSLTTEVDDASDAIAVLRKKMPSG